MVLAGLSTAKVRMVLAGFTTAKVGISGGRLLTFAIILCSFSCAESGAHNLVYGISYVVYCTMYDMMYYGYYVYLYDVMSRCTYFIVLHYIVGILPSRALCPGKITGMKDKQIL